MGIVRFCVPTRPLPAVQFPDEPISQTFRTGESGQEQAGENRVASGHRRTPCEWDQAHCRKLNTGGYDGRKGNAYQLVGPPRIPTDLRTAGTEQKSVRYTEYSEARK